MTDRPVPADLDDLNVSDLVWVHHPDYVALVPCIVTGRHPAGMLWLTLDPTWPKEAP